MPRKSVQLYRKQWCTMSARLFSHDTPCTTMEASVAHPGSAAMSHAAGCRADVLCSVPMGWYVKRRRSHHSTCKAGDEGSWCGLVALKQREQHMQGARHGMERNTTLVL